MKNRKNISIIIIIALILIISGLVYYFHSTQSSKDHTKLTSGEVKNFYDCVNDGYPSTNIYPRQCNLPDGTIFFEDLRLASWTITYKDSVRISSLKSNDIISSPLILKGEAKGWYFEGSFGVKILDSTGKIVGQGQAEATEDWMSPDYVPFTTDISFNAGTATSGKILLEKDNPSGLPEHDDSFSIPIRFEK